ncbi:MAG: hypothetical protein ACRDWA_11895 [Acidimicrobiia bacterium]
MPIAETCESLAWSVERKKSLAGGAIFLWSQGEDSVDLVRRDEYPAPDAALTGRVVVAAVGWAVGSRRAGRREGVTYPSRPVSRSFRARDVPSGWPTLRLLWLWILSPAVQKNSPGRDITGAEVFIDAHPAAATGWEAGVRLSAGPKVGPNILSEILCGGQVRMIVSDGDSHRVDYSDRGEAIPPAIRALVWRRDQGVCTIDGCRSRYRLQPHHIRNEILSNVVGEVMVRLRRPQGGSGRFGSFPVGLRR